MTKEEIIELLKENLEIELKEHHTCPCCCNDDLKRFTVKLKLYGETISEDWITI